MIKKFTNTHMHTTKIAMAYACRDENKITRTSNCTKNYSFTPQFSWQSKKKIYVKYGLFCWPQHASYPIALCTKNISIVLLLLQFCFAIFWIFIGYVPVHSFRYGILKCCTYIHIFVDASGHERHKNLCKLQVTEKNH